MSSKNGGGNKKPTQFLRTLKKRIRKERKSDHETYQTPPRDSRKPDKHQPPRHHIPDRGPITREHLLITIPSIRDVKTPEEKRDLFIKKLRLCSYKFDFNVEVKEKNEAEAREMKRKYLVELIDHLSSSKIWVSEESLKAILHMISANLFRPLPPSLYNDFDPDEDEPTHDAAWVHLSFVYEFLLRFIVSNNTDAKMLKKFIDRKFLLSIIDLFQSEDPRERDYLKTILHRIYGKFMSFRSFLRRAINNVFYKVIYQTEKHNGLAELLEILGSIINGFATPLKEEHQKFLRNVLIPLHKVKTLTQFHAQLAYCVVQFIEKDPNLASVIIGGLLKFWPVKSCSKELLFLSELEEVLEMTDQPQFERMIEPIFKRIAACIRSPHFQVAERALFLWNNDVIAAFMSDHRPQILPILYPALHFNCNNHWNATVQQLTSHIMQQFMDMDAKLFESVEQNFKKTHNPELQKQMRDQKWDAVKTKGAKNNAKNKPIQNGTMHTSG